MPLDNSIVKKMVQMGYSTKEVQAIVRNNQTSPILTTYHAIRNLSIESVPSLSLSLTLLNQDLSSALPSPNLSLSSADIHSTSSPISISGGHHHHHAANNTNEESENNNSNGNNDDDDTSTPPLLRLAIDLPPSLELNETTTTNNNDTEDLSIQFNDNDNNNENDDNDDDDSSSVLTHLEPFSDYRSKPGESDYYAYSSSFTPSSPALPTSHSFPYPHHSPSSSPKYLAASQSSAAIMRPRGESDPPVHLHEENEKDKEREKEKEKERDNNIEKFSLSGSCNGADIPPSPLLTPRQFSLEGIFVIIILFLIFEILM